jgi:TorA maturation chaperone TorD
LEKLHETYSKAYRLLSLSFLPPSTSKQLLLSHTTDIIKQLVAVHPETEGWHPRIVEALNNVKMFTGEVMKCLENEDCWEDFATEYSSLTVSGFKHVKCPPFESIYVVKGGYKMIEVPAVAESLDRYYSLLGLKADKQKAFGSDHISVELEFLAALHDVEAMASKGSLADVNPVDVSELRNAFLEDHLSRWVMDFISCLRKSTQNNIVSMMANTVELLLFTERYV